MSKVVRQAAGALRGSLALPGDKSIAHRALILGALAEGELAVANLPSGQDVRSTRSCLQSLGVRIRDTGAATVIIGAGLHGLRAPARELDCGNSGTTMRLLTGVLAGQSFDSVLIGDESLSSRPMRRVAEPLTRMGAAVLLSDGGRPPISVEGRRPLKAVDLHLGVPSAQVKSAVLLAGLFADGETVLEDPFGTRDHTERMLAFLGAGETLRTAGTRIRVCPSALRSDKDLRVPGDTSTAAFFAAAAALAPGSEVTLTGMLVNPTRMGFFNILREMGGRWEPAAAATAGGEPVGDITVRHRPLRALRIAAKRVPSLIDEVPLIAVLAAAAQGETRIDGLAELRVKESDRLEGIAAGLRALGADIRVDGDALIIRGGAPLKGAALDSRGDHRMAMAFSIAALIAEGETEVMGAECAAVSHPDFYTDLERLKA